MDSANFVKYLRRRPTLREPRSDRPLRTLAGMSMLTVFFTAVLVIGVVLWSAARSDQVTRDRQFQTVSDAITLGLQKIPFDQESVAYWDDAVLNVRKAFDVKWVDVNLGVWMYDYFKHDRVYILNAQDRVLYAMADGKQVALTTDRPNNLVGALATEVRGKIEAGSSEKREGGKVNIPRTEDLGFIEGRPAAVSVMPLMPHSKEVSQERGSESLIVSVRFLDRSFLSDMADAYLLEGVRFSRTNDLSDEEQAYPLKSKSGAVIGNVVWMPKLPGARILSEVLPVLAAGLFVIGIAVSLLVRSLRRTYTELMTSEAQARHLASHDTLTGLPNRAFFNDRLEEALIEVKGGREQIALMFLDLDRFKQVNDTLGHAAGDALIRELAAHLSATLRPGDALARMGGDEFAIVMRNIQDRREIDALCMDIVAAVSKPFEVLGGQAMVGISIGVAIAPDVGVDRSELARKADIALYQAKKNGRRRYQFFTEEMGESAQKRRTLEAELRRAIENENELEVVYQPLYSAERLGISGVEALVRWHHPRLGSVSPVVFVALAEECGLIDKLGDWVLRQACKAASAWSVETVAVNISSVQLRQPDFAERVLHILSETGMAPSRLEIEITESTLLDGSESSARALKILRAAGIRVALDDFGTGNSSLSYLMKLEVDRVKIDRSFVRHLGESSQSYSIVQAIVTMAHAVGLPVTAEGVETRDQQEFLMRIGCNHLQGYLLSPPLSALRLVEIFGGRKGRTGGEPSAAVA